MPITLGIDTPLPAAKYPMCSSHELSSVDILTAVHLYDGDLSKHCKLESEHQNSYCSVKTPLTAAPGSPFPATTQFPSCSQGRRLYRRRPNRGPNPQGLVRLRY